MPEFPSEWVQQFGVNLVTAYPSGGGARFRYFERLRPQPSFSAIAAQILASDPDFKVHSVGEMIRVVTFEGEYGAWVKLEGLREGSKNMRYLGAVFMGDFATALDCIVIAPELFAEFERRSFELLRSEAFHMGRRPRQYFYIPPAEWHGIPSGLVANFYPPDFPNNRTNISVLPATPLEVDEELAVRSAFAAASAGLAVESSGRDELISGAGVKGQLLRLHGRRAAGQELIHRELAIFTVHPYVYRMRLESSAAAQISQLREIFRGVATSFQPLPAEQEVRLGRAFVRSSLDVLDDRAS